MSKKYNVRKEGIVPFPLSAVFNAVADFRRFPEIFPSVKAVAEIGAAPEGGADVAATFNIPQAISGFLGGSEQNLRITQTPEALIRLKSIGGALKDMDIRWTFISVAGGAHTRVVFNMDYETGKNVVVDKTVCAFINTTSRNVIENLADYVRKSAPGA